MAQFSGSLPSAVSSVTFRALQLDSRSATRPLWLVKVPKYLAQAWEKAVEEDVGSLTITKTTKEKMDIILKIKDSIATAANIATDYDVPLTPFTSQRMAVLAQSTDSSNAGLVMDGHVNRRADVRPKGAGGSQYMDMKMAQIKTALTPARTVMQVDRVVSYKPTSGVKRKLEEKDAPRKPEKKLRDDKDLVLERLFSAFEKNQYINIKDLVHFTNQPFAYLKEILKEYCSYNVKNPHKNTWELKPQYRHYT